MRKNCLRVSWNISLAPLILAALAALIVCALFGCGGHSQANHTATPPSGTKTASTPPAASPQAKAKPPAEAKSAKTETAEAPPGSPFSLSSPGIVQQAPPPPLPFGTRAWNFNTKTLRGEKLTLTSLRGHVTVVDFWATWCGPCAMEIPHLENIYKQYQGKGVRVVGISVDTDTASQVPRFVREAHVTYTVAVDPNRNVVACEHYNAGVLPSVFVIDQKGVVRWCVTGYYDGMPDDLKAALNHVLSERA